MTDDPKLNADISGALKSAIEAHGPITREFITSATKRIAHQLQASAILDKPRFIGFDYHSETECRLALMQAATGGSFELASFIVPVVELEDLHERICSFLSLRKAGLLGPKGIL
jgi:hypothetical protein